jgi:hypothetical protein
MARLDTLKGITAKQTEALADAKVKSTLTLLRLGSTPDGRKDLARATKIDARRIENWVHRIDLARIKGITDDFARLLVRAGVVSVVELSIRNPNDLATDLRAAEAIERTGRRLPSEAVLQRWIEDARLMLRNVWYHDTWGDEARTGRAPAKYAGPRV